MNQRELAERFTTEVDHFLYESNVTDPRPTAPEYAELLTVAHNLAATDFSQQSRIRHPLRRRLLNRIETTITSAEVPGPLGLIKSIFNQKFMLATVTGVVLVLGLITLLARSELPLRQKMVELLAQIVAYLPFERPVGPHRLALRWQFRGQDGISSNPVAANGVIYTGSNDGYLYALDGRSGRELWRFKTTQGISLSPAVVGNTIYAISGDRLYALDNVTGQEKWQVKPEGQLTMGPVSTADLLIVGGADGNLYAVKANSGQKQWAFKAGEAILPYATMSGATLYVGSQDHYLYALAVETGREKWRFKAGNWISAPPVEVGGVVYVNSNDEYLYLLDAQTGQEQRRDNLGKAVRTSATLANGMIYLGSYDGYLHAVDGATGDEKWRFKMGKQTLSTPNVVEGVVYIGGGDGYLYALEAQTGAELARYGVDSHIYSAPAVDEDTIYFVSGKGELYAVQKTALNGSEPAPAPDRPMTDESPGFQFTPGGWYVGEPEAVIRFQGQLVDGLGNPVNGFSIQADNGTKSFLSAPSGPNQWQPQAKAGEWEVTLPQAEINAGWWWLTVVQDECLAAAQDFEPQCRQFSRLSESVKVHVNYPGETVIQADWTCQWNCRPVDKK
jgi:outer membrane protein assembly factor BamB